jgi:hypothetical protein
MGRSSFPATAEQAGRFATPLKVVAEPSRLRVVSTIASRAESGACGCELTEALGGRPRPDPLGLIGLGAGGRIVSGSG